MSSYLGTAPRISIVRMGTNPVRFRVECNKAKTSFWYTIVSGNGNTTMTSKAKYDDYDNALRAARRQAEAITSSPLIIEFERYGELVEEDVTPSTPIADAVSPQRPKRQVKVPPEPSLAVFEANLNPNF